MDRQLKDALHQVTRYLEDSGLRYAVVGGIALSYWNASRFTYDIDIKLLSYVEGWLSQFAEALETPELLARYLSLRRKVQGMAE